MNLYKNQLNRHTGSEIMSWILEVHLEDQLEGHLIIWNRWRRQLQLHSCRSRSSIGRSRWKAGNIRVVRRSSLKSVWPMLKVLTELIEPATLKLCGGRQRNQKIRSMGAGSGGAEESRQHESWAADVIVDRWDTDFTCLEASHSGGGKVLFGLSRNNASNIEVGRRTTCSVEPKKGQLRGRELSSVVFLRLLR